MTKLLEIKNLAVEYRTRESVVHAVSGVDLALETGDTLGLVGETGAGKTTIALSILRLLDSPPAKILSGEIKFNGKDLLKLGETRIRRIRGGEIAMIFQDPMTALNPVIPVAKQVAEALYQHASMSKAEAHARALEMLERVRIPAARGNEYPHQFSGGMRQRVVIAMALACSPRLVIADEPTTALDVTIQAQILDMMRSLKKEVDMAMLLITHDLGVVAETCDKVAIMYAGEIVEYGTLADIFDHRRHPYTQGLFEALPSLNSKVDMLRPIEGLMPDPTDLPSGCRFHPRCPYAQAECERNAPVLGKLRPGHLVRCHFPQTAERSE